MYRIDGNIYNLSNLLQKAGFVYNVDGRFFEGNEESMHTLQLITTPELLATNFYIIKV